MADVLHYNFEAINAHLDQMTALNTLADTKREELAAEMHAWAAYRTGQAHEAATAFTTRVINQLDHVLMASKQYVVKARGANEEMRTQELANTSQWV